MSSATASLRGGAVLPLPSEMKDLLNKLVAADEGTATTDHNDDHSGDTYETVPAEEGSVEDVDFLETNDVTVSPNSVATINCGSGDQCCLQQDSDCGTISVTGSMTLGGGPQCLTGGTVSGGGFQNCALSCTGSCNVSVAATGGGGGGGGAYDMAAEE